jgi:hypothetical protein
MPTARTPTVTFRPAHERRPVRFIPDALLDRVKKVDLAKIPKGVEWVDVQEAWLEVDLDDGWTAAYRVMPQQGQPVIGEVRVFPTESFTSRNPGEWVSGTFLGLNATVPAGGITTRLLRSLQTSETVAAGIEPWKKFLNLVPPARPHFARLGFRRLRPPRQGGRRGWSDEDLLRAAVDYVEIGGRRPVVELAKRWNLKRTRARDLLHSATEKEFLQPGRPGVANRGLTDKAKKALEARSKKK